MERLGLKPEDYADEDDVEVWPENEQAAFFFASLGMGNWNNSMNGRCGLNYESLPFTLKMRGIPEDDWPELFAKIQVMETAALQEMHKKTD